MLEEGPWTRMALTMPAFLRFMKQINPLREQEEATELGFSEPEFSRAKKIFLQIDSTNSGVLDKKAVLVALKKMGFFSAAKSVFKAFNALDTDRDGSIDFLEFLQITRKVNPDEEHKTLVKCEVSVENYEQYKLAFERHDLSDAAVIKKDQVWSFLAQLGIGCTEKLLEAALSRVDHERSGVFDLIDIVRVMSTLHILRLREEFATEQAILTRRMRGWSPERRTGTKQVFEYKRVFNQYDIDRTDKLRKSELFSLLKDLGLEEKNDRPHLFEMILDSVKEFDVTDNEPYTVGFDDFLRVVKKIYSRREMDRRVADIETGLELGFNEEEIHEFREVATTFDKNENHGLDIDEIGQLLLGIGQSNISADVLTETFKEFDRDNSGSLDFSEFLHLMKALSKRYEENPKSF